jgi:indolepyruvate ferredoxin oxidoreductase
LERTLFGPRLELARQYAALNGLNPVSLPTRDAWLGIVAPGKVYYELLQALRDLGLDQRDLEHHGVRLMKVGMLYPHDRGSFREFARGLDEVLVVEEKLPFLETALRDALYGTADAPRIVGKCDEEDRRLLPAELDLDADSIAIAVADRLGRRVEIDSVRSRVEAIEARRSAVRGGPLPIARTPYFCSGCPHNTSTVNPDDTLLGAGIGCHTMILLAPEGRGVVTGITQMGGEGAQFAGMQPFTDSEHFVQNVGDGTLHHSASLAIRFATASKLNITYKVLYNQTVAMTGGQDIVGGLSVAKLCKEFEIEGVKRIIVTTEDTGRYRGVELPQIAEVRPRERLAESQAELAAIKGVTVLIHDQQCAAEARRLRKRGKIADPPQRIHINERVCEGCGDCGKKSSCLSVLPVDTEFGRKTQIHQASCNKDYSCIKGDCPSFLVVVPESRRRRLFGGRLRLRRRSADEAIQGSAPPIRFPEVELPAPTLLVPRDDFLVRMPGVGGTGVVTVSQILQMASMLDGNHCFGLDQTGLSQKGGPVVSDVRIARDRIEGSNKSSAGGADLLLGFDVLGAANPKNLLVADPERTVAIVNTAAVPTAAMVTDTQVRFPAQGRNLKAIDRVTRADDNFYVDAQHLSEALFDDHMPTNTILLGAAYQRGCLPVSAAALEQAIRLNGAAVEKNLAAFAWGRAAVAAPERVREVREGTPPPAPVLDDTAAEIIDSTGAEGELRRVLEIRVPELIAYQNARYAREYADAVATVARAEAERGAPGETAVAEAYARQLYKLMAYKDEYEVARLHLDASERARVEEEFGRGARVKFALHPPVLRALGLDHKLKLGAWWMRPMFSVMYRFRWLRGKPVDVFGWPKVRRVERALIGEYRELMDRALASLQPSTHEVVARLADSPDTIRGYEEIKLGNVERWREEVASLEQRLDG